MELLEKLLDTLPDGEVHKVLIGLNWTAVVTVVDGVKRCGLASTLGGNHEHHGVPDVPEAGSLETFSGRELANFVRSSSATLASVGAAALNALLPLYPETWVDINAEHVIAEHGAGKTVALVGSFPFVQRLRPSLGKLYVIERNPQAGDLPEEAAPDILPAADVVAITAMTLINHSLENLLRLCSPDATIILLGPSTPLSPLLFEYGVNLLSGSIVTDIEPVLCAISQGANFRQVHRAGVRLVTMTQM
ncbi:MAG: DUF364 domain-containing protein [Anaerolineaceae bacterium]|nr:DUF364 domain-containing protein [Anaerolineaceae bacterium]